MSKISTQGPKMKTLRARVDGFPVNLTGAMLAWVVGRSTAWWSSVYHGRTSRVREAEVNQLLAFLDLLELFVNRPSEIRVVGDEGARTGLQIMDIGSIPTRSGSADAQQMQMALREAKAKLLEVESGLTSMWRGM